MGGIDPPAPVRSQEEIIAAVIEAGRIAQVPRVHTAWCVQDPNVSTMFYRDRSDLDNICRQVPYYHLDKFSSLTMTRNHTTFYAYKDREAAVEDALHRLALVGRRCLDRKSTRL